MADSIAAKAYAREVNRVERPKMLRAGTVNKVDHGPDPLEIAKVLVGRALKAGIGDEPLKTYGDKGLLSNVLSGEKVPDYLARIYQNDEARRRFARALLADDDAVRVRTVIEWDEEKAG
jgi:hypothetical protein